jgi:filamentous hemagglutinin family protein
MQQPRTRHTMLPIGLLVGLALPCAILAQAPAPMALPSGGAVTAGQARIQSGPGAMTIEQQSPKAIIEWQSFDVGRDAAVQFQQPTREAVTFNRVLDVNPSQIMGRIQANGQVFLSNANGVVFGSTAQVDVGGLIVTVHDIRDHDLLHGRLDFDSNSTAALINRGSLQARLGGYIAMLAPEVRNEGVVLAQEGTVAMASGRQISLTLQGSQLVSLSIAKPVVNALIENRHLVRADGGLVILSARSANALMESVIAQSGDVRAHSLLNRNGRVILDAGERGRLRVDGGISASGINRGTTGGRIVITGEQVELGPNAMVDARGEAGGGEVYLGGGWQGQDPNIRQAQAVTLESGSQVDASATQGGNGGTVVAWSNVHQDGRTRVQGALRATGGQASGDGGQIETSGARLDVRGISVDASATNGLPGQWLIDPYNVTISTSNSNTNNVDGDWTAFGDDSVIQNTDINDALDAGTAVVITTTGAGSQAGDIVVSAPIGSTQPLANLTLLADRNISVAAPISLEGTGSHVKLQAGGAVSGTAAISLNARVSADTLELVSTNGGAITQLSAMRASNLGIHAPDSAVTLQHQDNDIGLLAADVGSIGLVSNTLLDLQYGSGPGLTIGEAVGLSGVQSAGDASIASRQSHIYVLNDIDAGGALTLNAGQDRSPASFSLADERNVIVLSRGEPSCLGLECTALPSINATGLGLIYTGTIDGSQNAAFLAGEGSGRFRYYSDETITNFSQALGASGLHVVYRERPSLTAYADVNTVEYASTPDFSPRITGLLNGDAEGDAVSTPPSISIQATATSSSGHPVVGEHPTVVNADGVSDLGYAFVGVAGTAIVTPKAMFVEGFTVIDKVYDGSFGAQVTSDDPDAVTSTDLISGDRISVSSEGTFTSKDIGTDLNVMLSHTFGGPDRANYDITAQTEATASITRRPLNVGAEAADKVYDGTTTVSYSLIDNAIEGDLITATATQAAFDTKDAGLRTAQISGISISGNSAPNYELMNTATTATATITPLPIKISGLNIPSREYNGTSTIDVFTGTPEIATLAGDDVTVSHGDAFTLAYTSENVSSSNPVRLVGDNGTEAVLLSGADAGNYALMRPGSETAEALVDTTATILQKQLSFSSPSEAASRPYDGGVETTIAVGSVTGLVGTELVNISATGTFSSKEVGEDILVTARYTLENDPISGLASNYALADTEHLANITPKPIIISGINANDKVYDGNRRAAVNTSALTQSFLEETIGVVAGEELIISATGTFANAQAGTNKPVALASTYSGANRDNYEITDQAQTTATIEPRSGVIAISPGLYLSPTITSPGGVQPSTVVFGSNLANNYDARLANTPAEPAVSATLPGQLSSDHCGRNGSKPCQSGPQRLATQGRNLSVSPRLLSVTLLEPRELEQLSAEQIAALQEVEITSLKGPQLMVLLPRLSRTQRLWLRPNQVEELRQSLL